MIKCKYKNIASEIKKREPSVEVEVDHSISSLIHMDNGSSDLFNLAHTVLIALGYASEKQESYILIVNSTSNQNH